MRHVPNDIPKPTQSSARQHLSRIDAKRGALYRWALCPADPLLSLKADFPLPFFDGISHFRLPQAPKVVLAGSQHRAVLVGDGEPRTKGSKKSLTTGRHASRVRFDVGRGA
jgi:hypothetical protein